MEESVNKDDQHNVSLERQNNSIAIAASSSDLEQCQAGNETSANPKSKHEKEANQLYKIYNGKPEQLISLLRFCDDFTSLLIALNDSAT